MGCFLMIATPFVLAQNRTQQQVTTQGTEGLQVTSTFSSGMLDTFPWEKLLAFLGCVSLMQVLIVRLLIKPAMRSENDTQMEKMEKRFPSIDTFRAHEKSDAEFQKRVDRYIDSHSGPDLRDRY